MTNSAPKQQVNGHVSSLSASTSSLASTSASGSSTIVSNGSPHPASSANTSTHPDALSADSSEAATEQLADSHSVANHIYQVGFLQGHWSDVALHVASVSGFRRSFKAHAIIVVRSPFLSQLLCSSVSHEIVIPVEDSHITEESITIALAHLYGGPTLASVTRSNALAVLAAAIFLQLDDVAALALHKARHITLEQLPATLSFCAAHAATGNEAHAQASSTLLRAADEFLVRQLPKSLGAWGAAGEKAADELVRAYATLEFGMLRSVIESSDLPVRNDQERFAFAKKVAAQRKKLRSDASTRATLHPDDVAVEEHVVMAFGQGGGSNVRFMRKATRPGRFQKIAASAA